MLVVVTGGASSGKSAFAEELALRLPQPWWYVASMRREGDEAQRRIARHRALRAGKGFRTIELQDGTALPLQGTVLLEDAGNVVANGWEDRLEEALACENVVVVGNEVGCDGIRYGGFTQDYIEQLGALQCRLATRADAVVEVVAGIPQVVKGAVPEVGPWRS